MSKDKGVKNNKKSAAVKVPGMAKAVSSYKAESKSSQNSQTNLDILSTKSDSKVDKKSKH